MISDTWKTLALQAAVKAGEAILNIYNQDFKVSHKEDASPITAADVAAHNIITENLKETQIPILSEEGTEVSFQERKLWKQFWMVDPLDGTKEFVKRNGEFTVNIALLVDNIPVFGVIYIPVSGDLYVGGSGVGGSYKIIQPRKTVFWNEIVVNGITLSRKRTSAHTILTSRSHRNKDTEAYISRLKESKKALTIIQAGSSLKFCLLAEGKANSYARFSPCMEWDTAAGDAICQGVGLQIIQQKTDIPLQYNKESLLNPNFELI